jgi:DNA-binding MarR family transcriptional regulator
MSSTKTRLVRKLAARDLTDLDSFVLTDVVSHLLRRAHFRAEDIFAREFGADGLTPRQKALLITAYQNPGASQNELAEKIAIDRNSFAEMLSRMVANGYVLRARARDDARAYEIYITDKGVDLLREVLPRDRLVEERVIEPLPAELRPLFIKCLKIMAGLEK